MTHISVTQSCPVLCLLGSSVHEIVQARILETLVPRLVLATSSVTLPIAVHFLYSFFFLVFNVLV